MADELRIELYKSLRSEAAAYVEKVPALWLQKFLLVGAMIAVGVIENPGSPLGYWPVVAAVVALAIVLDAKMLEYGLHARLISSYIAEQFADERALRDWEHVLWGYGAQGHKRRLAKIRSWLTLVSIVVPTMVIALMGGTYIDVATGGGRSWLTVGSLVCLMYALLCVFAWKWMFTLTSLSSDSERPSNKPLQTDEASPRR